MIAHCCCIDVPDDFLALNSVRLQFLLLTLSIKRAPLKITNRVHMRRLLTTCSCAFAACIAHCHTPRCINDSPGHVKQMRALSKFSTPWSEEVPLMTQPVPAAVFVSWVVVMSFRSGIPKMPTACPLVCKLIRHVALP
jgi:hypothetical protein